MKYVSIDIETTGLDPDFNQVLSIGAIIEDTKLKLDFDSIPKFHAVIPREDLYGDVFALNMNADLINLINQYYQTESDQIEALERKTNVQFINENSISFAFKTWLVDNSYCDSTALANITAAGKNFGTFDKLFLEKLPVWKSYIKIKQRVIDPAPLYVDWLKDNNLPNLSKCKERAGLNPSITHNALEDAWDVIQVLRKMY